jgi:hypothetical protein
MESMDPMLLLGFRFKPTDEELISHYLVKKEIKPNGSIASMNSINLSFLLER